MKKLRHNRRRKRRELWSFYFFSFLSLFENKGFMGFELSKVLV